MEERSVLGEQHPDVATSFNNLALRYQGQERYAEAESFLQRTFSIYYEQQLGNDHPHVARNLSNLAVLYQKQGRYAEAELLCERSPDCLTHLLL